MKLTYVARLKEFELTDGEQLIRWRRVRLASWLAVLRYVLFWRA